MPDITAEYRRVTERIKEQLDGRGIELTTDDCQVAALAAISALTEDGMLLAQPSPVALEVQRAIAFFRGPENDVPDWPRERWVNAIMVKLGQAAHIAGLLLDMTDHGEHTSVDHDQQFEEAMIAVAAAAQDCVVIRREKRAAS